jgi:cobalt transporter subunit CbtB
MQASTALAISGTRAGIAARVWRAMAVLLFGMGVLYAVGFSTIAKVHNATHDTRHANGFPCH